MNSKKYEKYMKKCFRLALKAEGKTSPNPMVGCVVIDDSGKILSTGYHKRCGLSHAEPDALSKLAQEESKGATLIVNLEPCSHYGKTPPCADLIVKRGIKRIVIAMRDPNPLVSGKGLQICKKAGIEVIEGVLEKEAQELNEVFAKNMTQNKIFVALKTASTLDGKIATSTGDSKWITSDKAREEVQKVRNRYDAILTTSSTVLADNPSLTCRMKNGKNPVRIILDREFKVDLSSKVYNEDGVKIYLVVDKNINNSKINDVPPHIEVIKCTTNNCRLELDELMNELYSRGVKSLLVEAGGNIGGAFISQGLVDKIYHFIAPKVLCDNSGKSVYDGLNIKEISNTQNFKFVNIADFGPDLMFVYRPFG